MPYFKTVYILSDLFSCLLNKKKTASKHLCVLITYLLKILNFNLLNNV